MGSGGASWGCHGPLFLYLSRLARNIPPLQRPYLYSCSIGYVLSLLVAHFDLSTWCHIRRPPIPSHQPLADQLE